MVEEERKHFRGNKWYLDNLKTNFIFCLLVHVKSPTALKIIRHLGT